MYDVLRFFLFTLTDKIWSIAIIANWGVSRRNNYQRMSSSMKYEGQYRSTVPTSTAMIDRSPISNTSCEEHRLRISAHILARSEIDLDDMTEMIIKNSRTNRRFTAQSHNRIIRRGRKRKAKEEVYYSIQYTTARSQNNNKISKTNNKKWIFNHIKTQLKTKAFGK